MGEAVGLFTPTIFKTTSNTIKSGNVTLFSHSACPVAEVGVSLGDTQSRTSVPGKGYVCYKRDSFLFWRLCGYTDEED